jgi:small-conductance mechanosensitive channel
LEPVQIFGVDIPAYLYWSAFSAVFMIVWLIVGITVKAVIFGRLKKIAEKTKTRIDDLLISALNFPITLLIFVSGLLALAGYVPIGLEPSQRYMILLATTVLASIVFVDRAIRAGITIYSDRFDVLRTAGDMIQTAVRGTVFLIGTLVMLGTLGVNVTPIIASLGVGSLAVALALQPTFENFFSGMQLIVDKSIQQGQYIKLESGEEGFVEKIGWRSTWLRMLANNMVIIPNKTLVTSRVLNYHYPDKASVLVVPIGVHYSSDLKKVEGVAIEVAQSIQKSITGAVPEFEPLVRFHSFNSSSIDMNVILQVSDFAVAGLIRHEFIKAIHERFRREEITIPFPISAINLTQEKAAAAFQKSA